MVRVTDGACRTAKIIDLGLAKTAMNESASQAAISMPGAFAGTPEFASPEQFAGVGVDIRSDLYCLGVTLWEMLIGRVPFRGSPSELIVWESETGETVRFLSGHWRSRRRTMIWSNVTPPQSPGSQFKTVR
jgi:serine/threonine protein kinase